MEKIEVCKEALDIFDLYHQFKDRTTRFYKEKVPVTVTKNMYYVAGLLKETMDIMSRLDKDMGEEEQPKIEDIPKKEDTAIKKNTPKTSSFYRKSTINPAVNPFDDKVKKGGKLEDKSKSTLTGNKSSDWVQEAKKVVLRGVIYSKEKNNSFLFIIPPRHPNNNKNVNQLAWIKKDLVVNPNFKPVIGKTYDITVPVWIVNKSDALAGFRGEKLVEG